MADLACLIGKRIREIRKSHGLRQEDLEAYGIDKRYFQKIEAGNANITIKTLGKIASALKVEPKEFFDFPDEKSPEFAKLSAVVNEITKAIDEKKARELNILLSEILK